MVGSELYRLSSGSWLQKWILQKTARLSMQSRLDWSSLPNSSVFFSFLYFNLKMHYNNLMIATQPSVGKIAALNTAGANHPSSAGISRSILFSWQLSKKSVYRCRVGYWGDNCDECFPYPGCKNGFCRKPWECRCNDGWTGFLCDQSKAKFKIYLIITIDLV